MLLCNLKAQIQIILGLRGKQSFTFTVIRTHLKWLTTLARNIFWRFWYSLHMGGRPLSIFSWLRVWVIIPSMPLTSVIGFRLTWIFVIKNYWFLAMSECNLSPIVAMVTSKLNAQQPTLCGLKTSSCSMFKFMLPTTLTIEPRHSWQKESIPMPVDVWKCTLIPQGKMPTF